MDGISWGQALKEEWRAWEMETHTVKASEGAVGGLEHSSAPLRLPVVIEDKHPLCEEEWGENYCFGRNLIKEMWVIPNGV